MTAKIALVTGAGTGVGKAVATALAKAGYNLVLAGRRKEMLDKVSGEINAVGAQALAVPTDVSKRDSILSLFARLNQPSAGSTCCSTMPVSAPPPCRSRTCLSRLGPTWSRPI